MNTLVLGTFDGVHIAHREIINRAKRLGGKVTVCAFDIPPALFFGKNAQMLTDTEEKIRLLKKCGADEIFIQKFDSSLASVEPEEYIKKLCEKFKPEFIVTGFDHRFGKNASGDFFALQSLSKKYGFKYEVVLPVKIDGELVSSTAVRNALASGDISTATKMLGRYYSVSGTVIGGNHIGNTIGFPTVNITYKTLAPQNGVYASLVSFKNKKYKGMTNIGKNPTVSDNNGLKTETHIMGFLKDIYGETVKIEFLKKIRDEKKFASLDELKHQLEFDAKLIDAYIDNKSVVR